MLKFQLPVLSEAQSLTDAIDSMRTLDTRGFVLRVGRENRLIRNTELRDAWVAGARGLEELSDYGVILQAAGEPEASIETEPFIQILDLQGPIVSLESLHETIAHTYLYTSKVCICSKNPSHTCDSPPAKDGQACDLCDGTYECF